MKTNLFLWSVLVFSFASVIRDSSELPPELHRGEKMWMLIAGFPHEMWMLQQPKEEIFAFFYKTKSNFLSRLIKRLAQQEVQLSCFLLASENSDQMIRFNLFRFLSGKKVQFHLSRKNYRKFHSNGKRSKRYINNLKLFHAKQVFSRLTLKSKIAFTRTWKDILTVDHETRINKSLNHVSQGKK